MVKALHVSVRCPHQPNFTAELSLRAVNVGGWEAAKLFVPEPNDFAEKTSPNYVGRT